MRPIKYRLWNGGSMEPVGAITFHTDGSYHVNDEYPVNDTTMEEKFGGNKYYLMQFTGLLDRHGKEIYEGDVLKITDTFHTYSMPVIWSADAWTLKDDGTYGTLAEWNQTSEVIGNIYENPELLAHTTS